MGCRLGVGIVLGFSLWGCGGGGGSSVTRAGKIAFTSNRDGNINIYLMDENGSHVRKLTTSAGLDFNPSLSRDATHIVYASLRGSNYDLFRINADGTGETRLTNTPDADETQPDLSPDGRTIVFTRGTSIYAINSDGSGERRLTNSPGNSENASFNGRGDKLVFISNREGNGFQVYVMNVDGSDQKALTNDPGSNFDPRFRPDGTQIVFVSSRRGADAANSGIYFMNADGSKEHRIMASTSSADAEPAFSPDGQKVVFASNRADGNYNLYTIRTDGTMLTRLTNTQGFDLFPCWR